MNEVDDRRSCFALRSQRLVTPDGIVDGALLVRDGRIIEVVSGQELSDLDPQRWPLTDVGSHAVLPGLLDLHVHINEPGRTDWEGFATATRAAAAGGVTCLVDMPLNSQPVTTTVAALETKRAAARGQLWVDCALHGGLVPGNLEHLDGLIDEGVCGVKAFMVDSGIADFPAVGEPELRPAMVRLAARDVPLLVHAEWPPPVEESALPQAASPQATDRRSYAAWLGSRPESFEERAIELLIDLCRDTGCAVHIVHLATATALPQLRAARAAGLPLTVETCPHYLYFAAEDIPDGDPRFKCAPPIRTARHREALWQALEGGDIDLVASDHSPAPASLKCLESGDLVAAWGGIASLQVTLSAVWTRARQRGLGLDDMARWMSHRPAQRVGLGDRKGALAVGLDADFMVFDDAAPWTVMATELEHRHPVTPYDGETLIGQVQQTWVRGRRVFNRETVNRGRPFEEPRGRLLRRA